MLTTLAHLFLTRVPISTLGPTKLLQSFENMKGPEVLWHVGAAGLIAQGLKLNNEAVSLCASALPKTCS